LGTALPPVAITGATGFIGRALCLRLRSLGYPVKALVRTPENARDLELEGVALVVGDLSGRPALDRLLQDVSAVIHCAGAVRGNSQLAFDRTNVDGMSLLLTASRSMSPPPRFILLSSLAAREPELSWYARSKRRGEEMLRDCEELESVILRPPPVYGPGDREMLPIFKLMKRGFAPVSGSASSRISLVHVDDLVEAIICCLEARSLPATPFTPTDPRQEGYDWHEMAAIAERLWQRRVRPVPLPRPLLNGIAWCNLSLSRVLHYDPMLTPAKLRELRHSDWVASAETLTRATGWTPRIDLETGLAELTKTAL
jgi:nucleoside-diphosphate-sugar epimerase